MQSIWEPQPGKVVKEMLSSQSTYSAYFKINKNAKTILSP